MELHILTFIEQCSGLQGRRRCLAAGVLDKAFQIPEIPMFRALLKTRPFLPCGRRRISVPCPEDPCRAKYFRAVPCLAVPGSWYQILVPRSWYQDLGTIFREKVKPITTPPDKVFKLSG